MPRPDVSEERKEQILDAAAIVFSQQGFANARMDDIVKQSGLSKGALYWYFKSKDDIILALMHRFFDQDLYGLNHILELKLSAWDTLLQYTNTMTTEFEQVKSLTPLIYDYYSSATRDEEKRKFFQVYFQKYQASMGAIIQQGIDRGEFRPINIKSFVLTLIAMLEGLFLLNSIEEIVDLKQQVNESMTLLLNGIRTS